jgi:hypothetical protein
MRKQVAIERGPYMVVFNLTDFQSIDDKQLMIGYEQWTSTDFWKRFTTLATTLPIIVLISKTTQIYVELVNGGGHRNTKGQITKTSSITWALELLDCAKDVLYANVLNHKYWIQLILSCSITIPFSLFHIMAAGNVSLGVFHSLLIYLGFTTNQTERNARDP